MSLGINKINGMTLFQGSILYRIEFKAINTWNKATLINKRIQSVAKKSFDAFSFTWDYVKKSIKLTTSSINVVLNSGAWIESNKKITSDLRNIASFLKHFSICDLPLTIISIPSKFKKCRKAIQFKDHEGTFLSGLSCTLAVGGLFQSLTTMVNSTLPMVLRCSVKALPGLGPLGSVFTGAGWFTVFYSFYHALKFKINFENKIMQKISKVAIPSTAFLSVLNPFLDKHLGPKESEAINSRSFQAKIMVLERNTNKNTVAKLIEISSILRQIETLSSEQTEKIMLNLKYIKKELSNELVFKAGAVFTSILSAAAIAIAYAPVLPVVPYAFTLTGVLTQLTLKIYQDKIQNKKAKSLDSKKT